MGDAGYLRLLLSAADARHLAQASRLAAALAKRDRDRILGHQRRRAEIATARTAATERATRLEALRTEAEQAQAAAARAVEERNALLKEIDQRRDLTARLAGELQAAQQELQATLGELSSGRAAAAPALPLGPFRGDLEWPASGQVRLPFGARRSGADAALTNGVDIATAEGTPVRAIHEGVVAFAGTFAGYGKLVILHHGDQNFSLYAHLLDYSVARDASVERGQSIGVSGAGLTGSAGLYFELRIDGQPVDPIQWFKPR
jgi:septal ring factor EnvC (AmiA/AmiB activator)